MTRAVSVLLLVLGLVAVGLLFGVGRGTGADGLAATPVGQTAESDAPDTPAITDSAAAALERDAVTAAPEPVLSTLAPMPSDAFVDVRVRVVDDRGDPASDVVLYAETAEPDHRRLKRHDRRATTDADGRATLHLFDADFLIGVNRGGGRPDLGEALIEQEVPEHPIDIEVRLGRRTANLTIEVVDDVGERWFGSVVVNLVSPIQEKLGREGVRLQGLPVGKVWVDVHVSSIAVDRVSHDIVLRDGENLLRVEGSRFARVEVQAEPELPSESRANVVAYDVETGHLGASERLQPRFPQTLLLAPGRWRLETEFSAAGPWYIEESPVIDVRPGQELKVTLHARESDHRVSGLVVGGEQRVFRVWVARAGGAPFKSTWNRSIDGSFEIVGVPDGPLDLYVNLWPAIREARALVESIPAPRDELRLKLPPGQTLAGRILDAESGQLALDCPTVMLYRDDRFAGFARVHDGRFRFDGLPSGHYVVAPPDADVGSPARLTGRGAAVSVDVIW